MVPAIVHCVHLHKPYVIRACKCARPPLRPLHLPSPSPLPPSCRPSCPGALSPGCSTRPHFVYGSYVSRPWERLCVGHPFQANCQDQLTYRQLSADSDSQLFNWLQLGCLWFALYLLLPLLSVWANLTLLWNIRLSTTVAALLFSAYYEIISSQIRGALEACRQLARQQSKARYSLAQILEAHRVCYNHQMFYMYSTVYTAYINSKVKF